MWIAENLSKNSINKPTAESGNVVMSEIGNNAIIASGEHIGLDFVTPYGIVSIPPVKEKAVVLPLADKEVCVGVISEVSSVQKKLEDKANQAMDQAADSKSEKTVITLKKEI